MTTDITDEDLKNIQVPASLLEDDYEKLGEGIRVGFPSIRYKGKEWVLRHQGEEYAFDTPTIDVVILAQNPRDSQAYYPGTYDDDAGGRAPVCSSVDGIHIDPGVEEPQHTTCSGCPRNDWTGPRGDRKKECQTHRRLAVLPLPADTKRILGAPLFEPVFLKVPPGSLKNFEKYGSFLQARRWPYWACVTTLGFAPVKESLFAITFNFRQMLHENEREAGLIKKLRKGDMAGETQRLIGEAKIIREVEEDAPPFDPPKPRETGIGDFDAPPRVQAQQEIIPPKRPPGRPPGSKNKPRQEGNSGAAAGFAVSDTDTRGTDAPQRQPDSAFDVATDDLSQQISNALKDD